MDKFFIEGQEVNVSGQFSTVITLAIDDVKDFGAKNTAFSKTIIVPGTKNNNKIFGNTYEIKGLNNYDPLLPNVNLNFNASVKARCYYFRDNLQAIKGVVQLLEVKIKNGDIEYEVSITGELGAFISDIGSKNIDELDFSAYNHIYNETNVVASWDNAGVGSGYIYPLIDYGASSSNKNDWKITTFRPALFAKEYIDKIFSTSNGYTYDCPLFDSARFKGLIVPHNQKTLTANTNNSFEVEGSFLNTGVQTASNYAIEFDILTALGSFTSNVANTIFTYNSATTLTGNLKLTLIATATVNYTQDIYILLTIAGVTHTYTFAVDPIDSNQRSINLNETFLATTLTTGQTIRVRFDPNVLNLGVDEWDLTLNEDRVLKITTDANLRVQINYGEIVLINDAIPQNVKQIKFLSDILKLHNCLLYEDPEKDKVLKIAPFSSDGVVSGFYSGGNSEDWSLYLDRSETVSIKPMSELNARYYEFAYKDDTDFFNDAYKKRYNIGYGSYKYDSQYQFSKETERLELIFSATPLVGYAGEDKVYSTIFKQSGTVEENIDSNIRLLQCKKITGVASWHLRNAANDATLVTLTSYCYAGHLDDPDAPTNDLNFGTPQELFFTLLTGALNVNQFNVYWSAYMAEITNKDSRLMTATFKLPLKVIALLDFSKYKYIDGQLFRLNKVVDYNISREEKCKVELIKLINKIE